MAEYNLSQSQELKQEQILAPQQIQSLEILVTPLLQLQEKITQELADNPVLEQEKAAAEELAGDLISDISATGALREENKAETSGGSEEELTELMQYADAWQDYLPPTHSRRSYSEEDEEKRQYLFDSLTEESSLQEQMLEQLRFSELDPRMARIAEEIIGSIDDNGYLRTHIADIATTTGVELGEVEKALTFVQAFDPPGIGARDLKECLSLQLKRRGRDNPCMMKLVREHLDDIARNHLPQVAKRLKISLEELHAMLEELRLLNPYPGSAVSPENPVFVIPEMTVEKDESGNFNILSNDDQFPRLRISQLYLKLLEDPKTPEETRSYIKEKLLNGKMLIKSLEHRQSTIRRIAEIIVAQQHEFLEKGIEYLKPMTMQQVADKLDLHETTISRAIANKYITTPMGLFEFKFFFSGGYQAANGEELSSKSVKEKIRDMIIKEDSSKPLSDEKISHLLKEQGFSVARRTVAKYREEMNIQPSHLRKEF